MSTASVFIETYAPTDLLPAHVVYMCHESKQAYYTSMLVEQQAEMVAIALDKYIKKQRIQSLPKRLLHKFIDTFMNLQKRRWI